jgi:hypothetical protein
VVLPVSAANAVEMDLEAHLHATTTFPNAHGWAEYEAEHGTQELEISVAGARAIAGGTVVVQVHGDPVGRMRINSLGRGHREWHSGVATVAAGDRVVVRTRSGALVASGRFHHETD